MIKRALGLFAGEGAEGAEDEDSDDALLPAQRQRLERLFAASMSCCDTVLCRIECEAPASRSTARHQSRSGQRCRSQCSDASEEKRESRAKRS